MMKSSGHDPQSNTALEGVSFGAEQRTDLAQVKKVSYPGRLVQNCGHGLAMAATGLGFSLGAMADKADGATIINASGRAAAEALGAAQDDTGFFEGTFNSIQYHGSVTLIRGETNDWALTAAHLVTGVNGTVNIANITIGNGTSYMTDRGQTSGVSRMIINPNYTVTNNKAFGDFAVLRLTNRITNPNLHFTLASTIGFNQELLFTGFGLPNSLDLGLLPNTGKVMSFTGSFSTSQAAGYNAALYDSGQFDGLPGQGIGTNGDSGGTVKVWNPATNSYNFAGTLVAGNSSATFFYTGKEQTFQDILANEVRPIPSPEPGSSVLAVGGLLGLAGFCRIRSKKFAPRSQS